MIFNQSKKLGILLFIASLISLLLSSICGAFHFENPYITRNSRDTLYVGGSGPGNYSTIQTAIDIAENGDRIFIYNDSSPYYENLIINKELEIIGESQDSTIIDGSGITHGIVISHNYVKISNLTIQNSKNDFGYAAVLIHSAQNCILSNNTIVNTSDWPHIFSDGIRIQSSNGNTITENTLIHTWNGINLYHSNENIISGNTFINHIHSINIYGTNADNTIQLNIFEESDNNAILIDMRSGMTTNRLTILNNTMNGNYSPTSGGFEAITAYSNSENISIIDNTITEFGTAINLHGNNSQIRNNSIDSCLDAVQIHSGSIKIAIKNNLLTNGKYGISIDGHIHRISNNIINGFNTALNLFSVNTIVTRNQIAHNKQGVFVNLESNTGKIKQNNFIENNNDIQFAQFLPIRRHRLLNPIFIQNYYDEWIGSGPHKILGRTTIMIVPIILPIFPFIFWLPLSIPWFYYDWHPAPEPFPL